MACLLDTCIISELRKPHCDAGVAAWMSGMTPEDIYLSVITLGEIRRGIELHRRKDLVAAASLERWLSGMAMYYAERILPITPTIADRWGALSPHQSLSVADGLIAATAIEHNLSLVTRNVADFKRSGASIINPFSA